MVTCSVVGCKSRNSVVSDVRFYKYPVDEAIREKWRVASGLPESKLIKYQRICSKHFPESSFISITKGKVALKRGSIPTLNVHGGPVNTKHNNNVRDNKHNLVTNSGSEHELEDTEVIIVNCNSDDEIINQNSEMECVITETVEDDETEYVINETMEDDETECVINETMEDDETECVITKTETDAAVNSMMGEYNVPPEIRQLIFKLQRKAQVVESQKKTISRLRGKLFRLRKKKEELTATIEIMKNEAMKDHKGPSILLVGM